MQFVEIIGFKHIYKNRRIGELRIEGLDMI